MPRLRRPVAVLCIAALAFATILPGAAAVDFGVLEPTWVLLPDLASAFVRAEPDDQPEQPLSLLAVRASRAPPV